MRKILVPLVAGLMLFALAGCGNGNNSFLETEEGNKPSEIEGNMITSVENGNLSTDSADTEEMDKSGGKILIAFSRVFKKYDGVSPANYVKCENLSSFSE